MHTDIDEASQKLELMIDGILSNGQYIKKMKRICPYDICVVDSCYCTSRRYCIP